MEYETPGLVIREVDGITVLRLRHKSLTGTPEIAHIVGEVDSLLKGGARKLIIDLKYTEYLGSAALGMLISLESRIRKAGGKMVLSHPEHIAELLRVSNTAQLFKIAADLREAQKMF